MKKILISLFVISILILSVGFVVAFAKNQKQELNLPKNAVEVAPGVFYLGKAMDNGQVIESYAFVHYAKDSKQAKATKPVWDDTWDKYKFLIPSLRLKWGDTMQYEVDTTGSNFVGSGNAMNILGDSLETWNSKITMDLFDEPTPLTENVAPGENDEHNIVVWRDLGSGGTIAYNSLWFNPTSMEIIDSDVVFNSYYVWDDCESEGCATKMDLQNIATHEFGHNGLNDLYQMPASKLTMFGYSWYGDTDKRDLGTGDIAGIQALYG